MDASRRDQWAGTVFSTWVVLGLFLDGWAHNAGKPEDFWTPWHAVLYSGLLVGGAFYLRERVRRRRTGEGVDTDPSMVAGFLLFGFAGISDAMWHSAFGIEEDLAALLSPTHLTLMAGGLLLVTGPIRRTRALPGPPRRWGAFVHVLVSTTLLVGVAAFFLQFLSPFHVMDVEAYTAGNLIDEAPALHGIASILLTNALLLGGLTWLLTTWSAVPRGAVTAYLTVTALLVSSQSGFEHVALVAGPLVAGVLAEVVLTGRNRRHDISTVLIGAPVVLWSTWFATFHALWGIGWEVELWSGTIVLAALTGVAYDLLTRNAAVRPAVPASAGEGITGPATVRDHEPAPTTAVGG